MSKRWFYTYSAENGPNATLVFMQDVFCGTFVELIKSLEDEEHYINKKLVFCREINQTEYYQISDLL